jgi:hypothetical protein
MMKRLVIALAAVSLSMTGCSSSLCQDFADSFSGIEDKVKDCPSFDDVDFDEPTDAEIESCEENLDKCSDSDQELLNKFIDCLNGLDECTPSTENSFSVAFLACAAPLDNVSDACGEATSGSSTVVGKAISYSKAHSKSR